ncbi:MAG TPA: hydantoinase/oxoprolinase family protein [Streptosporangiaceae bacterium]
MAYVIGVDVGGTFTDAVLSDEAGTIVAAKAPSTPPDYSEGVLDVLAVLAGQLGRPVADMLADTHHVAHGTTSSLNALVTGHVPPVGFITTRGHRDSIYIMNVEGRYLGRSPEELQNVLVQGKSHGLIPRRHAWEITERLDRDGTVVVELNEDEARTAIASLLEDGVAAIAVSLLWSFRNPAHERRIRELVAEADPDVFVSLSSEVSPRIREFARSATTIMSTQIGPGLRDYLGGRKALDAERSAAAIRTRIAGPLGLSVEDAAAAIYAIQNAQTGDLLRKAVVEAGHDPREFVLYAFGGAGPAHCAAYAAEVGVREVVVPLGPVASAFSAYGLAASDIVLAAELSDPSAFPMDPVRVEKNFAHLEAQVRDALDRQGVRFGQVDLAREVDMRYSMQLAELATPVSEGPIDAAELGATAARFEQRYAELFGAGSGFREAGIQAITYRVRATGALRFSPGLPEVARASGPDPSHARTGTRPVRLGTGSFTDTAIYDYSKLQAGHVIAGPAVVEVPTTTVVVPGGMSGTVDPLGNLIIITNQESAR